MNHYETCGRCHNAVCSCVDDRSVGEWVQALKSAESRATAAEKALTDASVALANVCGCAQALLAPKHSNRPWTVPDVCEGIGRMRDDFRAMQAERDDALAKVAEEKRWQSEWHGALERIQSALAPKYTDKWWTTDEMEAEVMRLLGDFNAVRATCDDAQAELFALRDVAEAARKLRERYPKTVAGIDDVGLGAALDAIDAGEPTAQDDIKEWDDWFASLTDEERASLHRQAMADVLPQDKTPGGSDEAVPASPEPAGGSLTPEQRAEVERIVREVVADACDGLADIDALDRLGDELRKVKS